MAGGIWDDLHNLRGTEAKVIRHASNNGEINSFNREIKNS